MKGLRHGPGGGRSDQLLCLNFLFEDSVKFLGLRKIATFLSVGVDELVIVLLQILVVCLEGFR